MTVEKRTCECGCGGSVAYGRRFRKGHNLAVVPRPLSVEERFWAKVKKTDTCWLWTGSCTAGYGQFGIGGRKKMRVHRYAYELLVGPIPEGLVLDHLCRVRNCVNPDHLEPVTDRENRARGVFPFGKPRPPKTHCKRGHPLDDKNTYVHPNGSRKCRTCVRDRQNELARRRREEPR